MIELYEKRFNELRSAFDMERPNLISAWIALDEIGKWSDDDILSKAAREKAAVLIESINRIGSKCGYGPMVISMEITDELKGKPMPPGEFKSLNNGV